MVRSLVHGSKAELLTVRAGPFDWNSIMLYKCSAFSEKTDAPALTKIDGSKWKENMTPSNGDGLLSTFGAME